MIKKTALIALMFVSIACRSQEIFRDDNLGFSMEQPQNWIIAEKEEVLANLKANIKMDPNALEQLIKDNKGTISVVTYFKYETRKHAGVIPTIKVNLRSFRAPSFAQFKRSIELSFDDMKRTFVGFSFLQPPVTASLNNRQCVKALCRYNLQTRLGYEAVTVLVYAIPVGDQFYQITFMDSPKEDNSALFEKLANTIVIE